MPRRNLSRYASSLAGLALAFLSGCAVYRPLPLPASPSPVPDFGQIAAQGPQLRHPRLRPLQIDLSEALRPDQLAVLAVIANPDLKAARAKVGVAEAQAFAAGLLPDPQISLGFDQPIGNAAGLVTALSGAIAFDTSTLYRAPLLAAQARRTAEQAKLDLAWQEWQVAGQAKLLAHRITGLARQSSLAEGAQVRADQMLTRTLGAVARGDLKGSDVEARRIAAADTADRARTTQRDLAAARLDLNKLLGLPPTVELAIADVKNQVGPTASAEALFETAMRSRLDFAAIRTGYDSQEAAVRIAILDQYPRLGLTLTRARDTGGVRTMGPAVAFDLPLWNRNRGGIRIAEMTREQLRAEYAARLATTRSDLATLVAALRLGVRQRAEVIAQVEPLRLYVANVEAAARRGDLAPSLADTARQSLTDKEIAIAALDQSLAEQRAALELAVGALEETW